MTMSATFALLRSIANEKLFPIPSVLSLEIPHPAQFLMEALAALSPETDDERTAPPPTRAGIDTVCDLLFKHPAIAPLLADPVQSAALQTHFIDNYLLHATAPHFRDHWTYIILPAWNQHTDIQATLRATATATAT